MADAFAVYFWIFAIMVPVFVAILAPGVFLAVLTASVWYMTPKKHRLTLFMERQFTVDIPSTLRRGLSWLRSLGRKTELLEPYELPTPRPSLPQKPDGPS